MTITYERNQEFCPEAFQDNVEFQHHGIKGMKWGVRRYQNYDGTYTQAGLKRYNQAMEKYEKAEKAENAARARYHGTRVTGYSTTSGERISNNDPRTYESEKEVWKKAKKERKAAKKEVEKHYKHLKQDKLADQGKKLYSKGYTVTGGGETVAKITTGAAVVAGLSKTGGIPKNVETVGLAAAAGGIAVASILGIRNRYRDKRLRAFYSHTSNY